MFNFLKKIFGSHQERMLKRMQPLIDEINENYEKYLNEIKSEKDIKSKTEEFRRRLEEGETKEELLPEAFGLVKRTCKFLVDENKICEYTGTKEEWYMVPYDVQLVGAIVIHRGNIAEMATGEGKTLVATMPAYLNSLTGKVHIVTVNDYLARRDSQWMSLLYETLGVNVAALQGEMDTSERKEVYENDIVYGTNSQFGFDYLRDNMVGSIKEQVQKHRDFVIIDEVDSILIDEARTPLIISGPVETRRKSYYRDFNPKVRKLVKTQREYVSGLVNEGKKEYEKGNYEEAGQLLLTAHRGLPKHKQLMKLKQDAKIQKLINDTESKYLRDKSMHLIDENLYYTIDEKRHVADLTDKGREFLSPKDPELFELEDIGERLADLDERDLSQKEKNKEKRKIQEDYSEKSEILHSISQLLRAYSLFKKDVDYVVKENKVMIVDEFTGRLMPGRRFSEGLHEALEAKEEVKIEGETQTFATITLQNFFRMYDKISGMTGTAVTEEKEFSEIYDMDVFVIPTNEPVRRIDYDDVIYRSKKEKFDAVINEIARVHKRGMPVLVGTVSVEDSELLARMLKRTGIQASVLNAKNHAKEADIVAQAGQKKSVTIATNMAGRGTDIKLGEGVRNCEECYIKNDKESPEGIDIEECKEDMPCGLYVIGTQRHESRRVDRQLRGRSGRQGDPGASRFFISLEDKLMRLFGSDRIIGILNKMNMEEGQAIQHPLLSKQIEKAQQKVEERNFQIRKHTLEYDDVMNKQRTVIYDNREYILEAAYLKEFFDYLEGENEFKNKKELSNTIKESQHFDKIVFNLLKKYDMLNHTESGKIKLSYKDILKGEIKIMIEDIIDYGLELYCDEGMRIYDWDFEGLKDFIFEYFTLQVEFDEDNIDDREALFRRLRDEVFDLYEERRELMGEDLIFELERVIMLRNYDNGWREHLYAMDDLIEGINLRAYAQKDPLIEYKKESFEMFQKLNEDIEKNIVRDLFHMVIEKRSEAPEDETQDLIYKTSGNAEKDIKRDPIEKDEKVGRNDPCPCGSGKKYKHCCWPKYED